MGWDDDEAMTMVEWNVRVMDNGYGWKGLSAVTLFVCVFIWFIPMPSFIFPFGLRRPLPPIAVFISHDSLKRLRNGEIGIGIFRPDCLF